MKRFIALATMSLLALSMAVAQPAEGWFWGKTIRDIRFEGLTVVQRADLDPIVKEFKGQEFSEELYDRVLGRIYGLDFFTEVLPEAVPGDAAYSSLILLFRVVERPAVASVAVRGNRGLRSSELLDAASIKPRTIFNQSRIRLDEIALRQLYQGKGYVDARVSTEQSARADGSVDLVFVVEEGLQHLVERIEFQGASAFSTNALKGEVPLKERGLFQSGQFSEARLAQSITALEAYYKNRGFIDAAVLDVRREWTDDGDRTRRLRLSFVISEGSRYLYGGMSFDGNTLYTNEELAKLVRQRPGVVLNYQRLMEDQGRVADLYYDNGYIFNAFELVPVRDEDAGSISFVLQIAEGPQALIERVEFRGNVKTKEFVLRREVPIADGEVFSKAKIMDGLRNLYNLQFFSAVSPEYEMGSREPYVVLVINVTEQSTADIQFGISYIPAADPNKFPLIGLVKWNDRNFLGNGNTFSAGINVSPDAQDLTFSFRENWLMGRRWSGGVDFTFAHSSEMGMSDNDFNGVPDPYATWEEYEAAKRFVPNQSLMAYENWSFSIGFSSGYTFKLGFGDLGLGGGYSFGLNNKTYEAGVNNPFESSISENLNTWLPSNSLFARAFLNGLDIWYDPSKGYYLSQRLSLVGFLPSEQSRFLKADTRAEAYLTLADTVLFGSMPFKAVFGLHSGFSTLLPWFDGEITASASQRPRIDGTFNARGWNRLWYTTGDAMWENWAEVRVPVVPGVLAFDAFLDAAALKGADDAGLLNVRRFVESNSSGIGNFDSGGWGNLSLENFAFSYGFGMRFAIPQFPFRMYFARTFYMGESGLKYANPRGDWDFVLSITMPLQ